MELAVFAIALVGLSALALAFGTDSRPGFQSGIHTLMGLQTMGEPARQRALPSGAQATVGADQPSRVRYPTLHLIDRLGPAGTVPFASDPRAESFERRARKLAAVYRCDGNALTPAALEIIRAALEHERRPGTVAALEPAVTA